MIGVVVWSSVEREKAVIWCEDHASLAYLQGQENLVPNSRWPQPGDLVELDYEEVGVLRNARRVSLLSEQEFAHLPGMLKATATPAEPRLRVVASTPQPEPKERPMAAPELRAANG